MAVRVRYLRGQARKVFEAVGSSDGLNVDEDGRLHYVGAPGSWTANPGDWIIQTEKGLFRRPWSNLDYSQCNGPEAQERIEAIVKDEPLTIARRHAMLRGRPLPGSQAAWEMGCLCPLV